MDDYISREAALQGLCNASTPVIADGKPTFAVDYSKVIKALPAADVRPVKRGKWDGTADGYADGNLVYDMWECSCCGFDADGAEEKPTWNFCPNCGADMSEYVTEMKRRYEGG